MTPNRIAIVVLVACGSKPAPPQPVARPAPACTAAADHMLDLVTPPDRAKRIRDVFERRCEADAWPDDVRACIVATTSLHDPKGCKRRLAVAQREALERDLADVERAADDANLTDCDKYKQAIERLMKCDKLPQESRDALKHSFDAMEQTWKTMNEAPEAARQHWQAGCKAGTDALAQAVADVCGW